MNDSKKFWLQTLIIPVILAIVGFKIDGTLQDKQRVFDKVKFTDQVLNEAFDASNADKAMALAKLIPQLVDDKPFADTLIKLISNHFFGLATKALQNGYDSIYSQISDAAKTYHLDDLSDTLNKNPVTADAEKASVLENTGLIQIQQGNFKEAQTSFEKADKVYPGFHSSNEISNFLKGKVEELKHDGDSVKIKQEVIQAIRKNYSWKMSAVKNWINN
jgi:tetratricopeptide (TPR) repeat protein